MVAEFLDADGPGAQLPQLDVTYLHGPAVDQILVEQFGDGTVYWHLADQMGTIRDLIDNSGNLVDHLKVNAYGAIVSQSNSGIYNHYVVTGRDALSLALSESLSTQFKSIEPLTDATKLARLRDTEAEIAKQMDKIQHDVLYRGEINKAIEQEIIKVNDTRLNRGEDPIILSPKGKQFLQQSVMTLEASTHVLDPFASKKFSVWKGVKFSKIRKQIGDLAARIYDSEQRCRPWTS